MSRCLRHARRVAAGQAVVFARVSSVDGVEEGGIGGAATMNRLARSPGFQVPFSHRVRTEAGIQTIAVGLIMTPEFAAEIVDEAAPI